MSDPAQSARQPHDAGSPILRFGLFEADLSQLDAIRGHPRFPAILERVRSPQAGSSPSGLQPESRSLLLFGWLCWS